MNLYNIESSNVNGNLLICKKMKDKKAFIYLKGVLFVWY